MSDDDKARENYQYFQYCREQGHDAYLRDAETALAFFVGKQWTDEELSVMRETGRPALTLNQFFRNIDSITGEMIYATGDVRFTPTDTQGGDDVSSVLDKVYANTIQQNKVEYLEPALLLQGMLTGRAYYDVRVNFDEQMQGQVEISAKRPQNVVLSPTIESPDPDKWPEVYETSIVSMDDISLTYGEAAAQAIGDVPQADWLSPYDMSSERLLSQQMYGTMYMADTTGLQMGDPRLLKRRRLIERQYREIRYKEFFIDTQTGDMSMVPNEWDRARIARVVETTGVNVIKRRTSTIRWRVSCDRFLLHDSESPYKQFTIVPFFPYFVDGYPMSLGSQLVDMQRMTNKLYSQVLHILNSAANSGWKVKQGALKNMTMEELQTKGAQTGLIAELDDVDNLERIEPGQLPSGHDSMAQTISAMFKDISGYTSTIQSADRADANSKSTDAKMPRGQVNLATAYKALYHTKTMVANRVSNLAKEFYTETRLLHITHGFGMNRTTMAINQPTPEGKVLNDITVGKYDVTVVPAPSRETVMQSTFQQLFDLRKELGVQVPDDVLIEYSALPDKSKVLEAIQNNTDPQAAQAQQQMQQQMAQAELNAKNAAAANAEAQGQLAKARSLKAIADANSNPQADRIALDRERLQVEQQRDARQAAQTQQQSDTDSALQLTSMRMDHQHKTAALAQANVHHAQDTALTAANMGATHAHAARESHKDTVMQDANLRMDHQHQTRKMDLQQQQIQEQAALRKQQAKQPKTPTTPRGKGA